MYDDLELKALTESKLTIESSKEEAKNEEKTEVVFFET